MKTTGKVVLIVGASSGIGRGFALAAAREGAILAVSARRRPLLEQLAGEVRALGQECLVVPADATDEPASAELIAQVVAHYGRIDIALFNAGGAGAIDTRVQSAGDVTRCMRQNYDVVVNPLMPTLAQMSSQGHGLVMVTNSLAAFVPLPLQGPYSAAKGALRLLVDTCRLEYANRGIRFISVYPGFVSTEATQGDGMEPGRELSPEQAVAHLMRALDRERPDYLFPFRTAVQIRAGQLLPAFLQRRILAGFVTTDPRDDPNWVAPIPRG
jgi:NAD(P)-dependent dehydrogenase (short-subunit alcohol dehydrogenase family)